MRASKITLSSKDLDTLVDKHAQCISLIIRNADKRDLETILRDTFDKEALADSDISDILGVWEAEKHLIYKKIVNQNVNSAASYQGLNWAIRKGVAARGGTLAETPSVDLTLRDKSSILDLSLTKHQFSQIVESVRSGSNFLNDLFQPF